MQIDIGASFCRVTGTKDEVYWLREILTFDVPGAKYTPLYRRKQWDGKKRFFNTVASIFPVGLLNYVVKHQKGRPITFIEHRDFPKVDLTAPILNTIELREYQKKAIEKCLQAKNCLIEAATNAGKTAIFSGIIKKLHPIPILVLTHRGELLTQTVQFIEQYTGLECGFITSKDVLIKPVTVAMVATLTNRIGVDTEITEFYESVKCIICDEVHHSKSKTYSALLSASKAPYRFGFSGTIPDEDTFEGCLVRSYLGSVAFRITNEELIDMKVSAKPKIHFYEMDVQSKLTGIYDLAKLMLSAIDPYYTPQRLMKQVYQLAIQKGIVENKERNEKVLEILKANPYKSTLIVVDLLEHGRIVQDMLNANNIHGVFISGESPHRKSSLDNFKAGKLLILISTNIIDEGIDISKIEVLIMLAGKKNRRQVLQRVGRSLRRKDGVNAVSIYDFLDLGNRYLANHSKLRYNIYKNEGFEIEIIS